MSEQITRTITESLTHEDVQNAVLELVAKRNPPFKPLPDDAVTFTRKWSPTAPGALPPGMTTSLDVDVKVVQEVKPARVFMESTPSTVSPSAALWMQRSHRPFKTDVGCLTEGFRIHDETISFVPTFERDLISFYNIAARLRNQAFSRNDNEAVKYFGEVMGLLNRDIGTVSAR